MLTWKSIPPTKILDGIMVPYFGAAGDVVGGVVETNVLGDVQASIGTV